MFKVPLTWVLTLPIIFALAVFPTSLSANHAWGGYHWARTNNPFQVTLGRNVALVWKTSLITASTDWTVSPVLDTSIVPGGTNPANCLPTPGRVEVCAYQYGLNGWLGLAQIWVDNANHISQGVVKLNNTYFKMPQYKTQAWMNLVACQEIGHTLGLDHQDTDFSNPNLGTCMDYTSNPAGPPDNEHPNQHDYDELASIYTHVDASDVTTRPSPQGLNTQLSGPRPWGVMISGSPESGTSIYELDLGGGNKVITYVTWTH